MLWEEVGKNTVVGKIGVPEPLFKRISDEELAEIIERSRKSPSEDEVVRINEELARKKPMSPEVRKWYFGYVLSEVRK